MRAEDTTPEVEFALFDAGCCELQADEPGTNREAGYRTTAGEAKRRLSLTGVTAARAREVARLITEPTRIGPSLAERYARGQVLRLLAREFDAGELLEGHIYNGALKSYMGRWLNLHQLSRDLNISAAANVLQALYLAIVLDDVSDDAAVVLSTSAVMSQRRPGERSWRRAALDQVVRIPGALLKLANDPSPTLVQMGVGPSRAELIEAVRARLATKAKGLAREKLSSLERKLVVRDRPKAGPLSDASAWAVEDLLTRREFKLAQSKLEPIERARGKIPATVYLRIRLAVMTEGEAAGPLAEKASSLAQSSSDLPEAKWLAAQAWLLAGNVTKARAFATLLLDDPEVADDVRMLALDVLDACPPPQADPTPASVRPSERKKKPDSLTPAPVVSLDAAPKTDREPVILPSPDDTARRVVPPPVESTLDLAIETESFGALPAAPPVIQPPQRMSPSMRPQSPSEAPPTLVDKIPAGFLRRSTVPAPPPPMESDLPIEVYAELAPIEIESGSMPAIPLRARTLVMDSVPSPVKRRGDTMPIPPDHPSRMASKTVSIAATQQHAKPGHTRPAPPPPVAVEAPLLYRQTAPNLQPDPIPIVDYGASDASMGGRDSSRGASLPPFRLRESPSPIAARPSMRPPANPKPEVAENLSFPPGLHGHPPPAGERPRTIVDARLSFIYATRVLGRELRLIHGLNVKTNVKGLEQAQERLAERFPEGYTWAPNDIVEVEKYGAFLSEMLARNLGAGWIDISPPELGHWSMLVPPGVQVWPFGRILRFVLMGAAERNLVDYYKELEKRANA